MTEHGQLTQRQIAALLKPIKPARVYQANGQSHVAIFDVTAHLTRVFGFDGWDKEILDLALVREFCDPEAKAGQRTRPGWWVTYRCTLRLTVRDPQGRVAKVVEEAATGTAENQPSYGDAHDLALKNAVSYAVKRCAKDLGDQFGLSLYNKGSRNALVGMTIVDRVEDQPDDDQGDDLDEHVDQVEGEGDDPTVIAPEPESTSNLIPPDEADTPEPTPAPGRQLPDVQDDTPTDRDVARHAYTGNEPADVAAAVDHQEAQQPAQSTLAPDPTPGGGDGPDPDQHPLEPLLASVADSPTRAKSTLLREAAGIARDQGLRVSISWDDLRDGPIADALLERHGAGS